MKKRLKLLAVVSAATMLAASFTACGGGSEGTEHKHTYGVGWIAGETTHWHESTCEHTGLKSDEAMHFDGNNNGMCDVCNAVMSVDYGRLIISDILNLEVGTSRVINPRFTVTEYASAVEYSFDSDAISIEGDRVTALKAGATVTVTATTARHTKTFKVTTVAASTAVDFGTVNAYVGYSASPFFLDAIGGDASVTYTYDNSKISIDQTNRTVTALQSGSFRVEVKSGEIEGAFTVNGQISAREDYAIRDSNNETYAKTSRLQDWNERGTAGKSTLFIGDSFFDLRYDFWANFYTDLAGKDAVNGGISGTTAQEWEGGYYDVYLSKTAPKNLVINLGTNNLGRGESASTAAMNLQRMLLFFHSCENLKDAQIYWFNIAPRGDINKSSEIVAVNKEMSKWCAALDWVTAVDVNSRLDVTTHLKSDKLHPQATTYTSVYLPALATAGIQYEIKN
ncbi:MAG: SGNH/GDSL hydrolase family protein [Clostridiales bacterium]|nr:SGNH/GDSL hydrolase family protein [Clostridiales bacterium]